MRPEEKKILIIDDDADTIRLLEKPVINAGCGIITAFNGEAGLELAREKNPAVIILDLMLPGKGGLEVAEILQSDPRTKDIPIVFITVTMGVELDKGTETIEVGGKIYPVFAKPLHYARLLSEIRKSINRTKHGNIFQTRKDPDETA